MKKSQLEGQNFLDNSKGHNFFYVHSAIEKNIGKIISVVKIDGIKDSKDLGTKIAMHITASKSISYRSRWD